MIPTNKKIIVNHGFVEKLLSRKTPMASPIKMASAMEIPMELTKSKSFTNPFSSPFVFFELMVKCLKRCYSLTGERLNQISITHLYLVVNKRILWQIKRLRHGFECHCNVPITFFAAPNVLERSTSECAWEIKTASN